jgi:hypothetical protein
LSRRLQLHLVLGSAALIAASGSAIVAAAEDPVPANSPSFPADPRPLEEHWRQATECWRRLARIDTNSARRSDIGRLTVDRFLESAHSRALVTDLCELFSDSKGGDLVSHINIHFADEVPASLDAPDGSFLPARARAKSYDVTIRAEYRDAAIEPTVFVFGEYPDNPNCAYVFFYRQAESSMAQTLYHELLHIWFMNKHFGERRRYVTGHGLVSRCEFEQEFLELLAANAAELSAIEGHPPLHFGSAQRQSIGMPRSN